MSVQNIRRGISTSVAITDPLVKYRALLATGVYSPDPAQHRLARHLQKIYTRLKDYEPPSEYRTRLNELTSAIDKAKDEVTEELAVKSHPIRNNPLFSKFFRTTEGPADSLALTRVLTSHQAALDVDSPKGLFLSGEVGTGKSMLLDLLADGLPTNRKKRWHFNTFMLYAFSKLEQFRKSNPQISQYDSQYSLLWMAKEMVETSPVLFLDEFQLPDRAASKLLSHLFIAFFQLGGVLIASSNRMPEELEKATGVHYSPPPGGRIFGHLIAMARRSRGELYGQTSDFAAFLDVLKARCDFWQMEGAKDWRRRDESSPLLVAKPEADGVAGTGFGTGGTSSPKATSPILTEEEEVTESQNKEAKRPLKYLTQEDGDQAWLDTLAGSLDGTHHATVPWEPAKLVVYGRYVTIPRQHNGTAYWDFSDLVHSFGPADYVTLASTFHTFIVDRVPVLDMSMKNEARRFITFLDAVYEARCKLIIRAQAGPDDLFFPETRASPSRPPPASVGQSDTEGPEEETDDATYSETISEVYQDQMSPFRPNISTYADSRNAKYDPDQDSDFKLDHGAAAAKEAAVNFSNTSAFTGEDERFAYKRATSRLWELCGAHWHARAGGDWWQPLPAEARHWEGSAPSVPLADAKIQPAPSDISFGPSVELEEPAGLERFKLAAMRGGRR